MICNSPQERPRERCLQHGPQTLSLRECLAVLIGTGPRGVGVFGVAEALLKRAGSEVAFFRSLETGAASFLEGVHGLGPASRSRILVAFELARRYREFATVRKPDPPSENPPSLVPDRFRHAATEWMGFVAVIQNQKRLPFTLVSTGTREQVSADASELFAQLLAVRPVGFFFFHNHPSGNPTPSAADIALTAHLQQVAQLLEVQFYGHWIITPKGEKKIEPRPPPR